MSKRRKAVAEIADCSPRDLVEKTWDHYGLTVYSVGSDPYAKEYAVGTDEEADDAATEYIKGSLWAFNPDFLATYTDLPDDIFRALGEKCEDGNNAVLTLVERTDGGLEGLVDEAITSDGRGHFMSSYDGNEHEVTIAGKTFYVYRTN